MKKFCVELSYFQYFGNILEDYDPDIEALKLQAFSPGPIQPGETEYSLRISCEDLRLTAPLSTAVQTSVPN